MSIWHTKNISPKLHDLRFFRNILLFVPRQSEFHDGKTISRSHGVRPPRIIKKKTFRLLVKQYRRRRLAQLIYSIQQKSKQSSIGAHSLVDADEYEIKLKRHTHVPLLNQHNSQLLSHYVREHDHWTIDHWEIIAWLDE